MPLFRYSVLPIPPHLHPSLHIAAREAELARLAQEQEASQRAFDNQMMLEKMRLEASSQAASAVMQSVSEKSVSGVAAWLMGKLN